MIALLLRIRRFFLENSWYKSRHLWFRRDGRTYWWFRLIFFIDLRFLLMSFSLSTCKLKALILLIFRNVQMYWRFWNNCSTFLQLCGFLIFLANIGVIMKSSMIYLFFFLLLGLILRLNSYHSKFSARFRLIQSFAFS